MRKNILKLSFLAVLAVGTSCNFIQPSSNVGGTKVDNTPAPVQINVLESDVRENLEYLASNELRGRETGTEGIEKAAFFIEEKFRSYGIKPYFETYRDSFETRGVTGYNVVGYLEGNHPTLKNEFIILGAHYDHIGIETAVDGDSIANGANDNAAGTVAVMELAKHFGGQDVNGRSLLFILFSAEEMGLQGAKHISSRLKEEGLDLYTMVNFEMIGIPMQQNDYLAYLTGYEISNMAQKFNEYSDATVLGFLPQAKEYNLFRRSDNYSFFQEFNIPAQTISTFDFTNYDYYHHVADEANKMDYSHMVNLIESVIPAITKMTNTAEKEIKMN